MFEYHCFMLNESISFLNLRFENDVKTYGTQAVIPEEKALMLFENDVKTYGTQAPRTPASDEMLFENDVKTYGTQATIKDSVYAQSLRMM